MITFKDKQYNCPLEMTIDLVGGKWKVLILWNLYSGSLRFNELRRIFPDVTQKMLTQQLRDLENNGLITRKVYPEILQRLNTLFLTSGVLYFQFCSQ